MPILFILPFILLATCTPLAESTTETASAPATATPPPTATDTVVVIQRDSVSVTTTNLDADSSIYIGEIGSFPETGELYTFLYYHNYLDVGGLYESLAKQTDSVIYDNNEYRRSRLSTAVAGNYFDLSGLDDILVYKQGRLLGEAEFVRVEYFQHFMGHDFIAVFKPIGSSILPDELDYCVSAGKNPYTTVDIAYEEIEDEELTKTLLESFVPLYDSVWNVSHTHVIPYNSVFSAISLQSRLLLIETGEGQSRILKDLKEDWFISDITPLHLESNGKPILLLTIGVNETDMMWTSLAIFEGEEYVFPENNRVTQR